MESLRVLLELVLRKYARDASAQAVRMRMQRAAPRIVREMERRQVTPEHASARIVIRDALFRLWRAVIPSGDLADLVRDLQDDPVVSVLEPQVSSGTPVSEVVRWVMEEALDRGF